MRSIILSLALTSACSALAQEEDIPTLEPELKQSPTSPGVDSDMLEPLPPPPAAPPPDPAPEPESMTEPVPEESAPPEPRPPRKKPHKPKRRPAERPTKAEAKPKKEGKPAEVVIVGLALKYGFTSLAGSASEDDNSPTFGGTLFLFQAPSPAKDSLGITAGLMLDYEETNSRRRSPLRRDSKARTRRFRSRPPTFWSASSRRSS